ncbi:uncharacterized protein LOC141690428 [Apium graveolens]|uniref:uncharacterized protein LOC141690428 n=1 Tax=Apium graveolens TaxID=4045 RepID=UPI003D7A6168
MDANVSNNKSFWTRLWHLKILLKVKHFMWRVICDCLPIKDCLLSRRVEVDSKCPVCNLIDETSLHALVFCLVAALCWKLQGVRFDSAAINNTTDWVQEIYQHSGRSEVNKIFMIAWMIWNNRNDVEWKQKGRGYKDIVTSAIHILNNWEFAQDRSFDFFIGFISQTEGNMCWKQPQTGTIKINTDAALFKIKQAS